MDDEIPQCWNERGFGAFSAKEDELRAGDRVMVRYRPGDVKLVDGYAEAIAVCPRNEESRRREWLFRFPGSRAGHDGSGAKEGSEERRGSMEHWFICLADVFGLKRRSAYGEKVPIEKVRELTALGLFERYPGARVGCSSSPGYAGRDTGHLVGAAGDRESVLVRFSGSHLGHDGLGLRKHHLTRLLDVPERAKDCWWVLVDEIETLEPLVGGGERVVSETPDTGVHPGVVPVSISFREEYR